MNRERRTSLCPGAEPRIARVRYSNQGRQVKFCARMPGNERLGFHDRQVSPFRSWTPVTPAWKSAFVIHKQPAKQGGPGVTSILEDTPTLSHPVCGWRASWI